MAVRAKIWFFCLLLLSSTASAQQPSAIQVGVVPAEKIALADTNRFVGRIEAIERVDVRARVTGFLENPAIQIVDSTGVSVNGVSVPEGVPACREGVPACRGRSIYESKAYEHRCPR
jgi:hypothetical protein